MKIEHSILIWQMNSDIIIGPLRPLLRLAGQSSVRMIRRSCQHILLMHMHLLSREKRPADEAVIETAGR